MPELHFLNNTPLDPELGQGEFVVSLIYCQEFLTAWEKPHNQARTSIKAIVETNLTFISILDYAVAYAFLFFAVLACH